MESVAKSKKQVRAKAFAEGNSYLCHVAGEMGRNNKTVTDLEFPKYVTDQTFMNIVK
ncbi:MAG: hypothetical protein ACK5KP_10375 [Paludibacteraceae bacterium]